MFRKVLIVPMAALFFTIGACQSDTPVSPNGDRGLAPAAHVDGTVEVRASDIGVSWFETDTRGGASAMLAAGPGTAPLGDGSMHVSMTGSADKYVIFNYDDIGLRLAEIDAMGYWSYRSSASSNSASQVTSINLEVDYVGDGSSYTTLVFEPVYNVGQGPILADTWQSWDAYDSGGAIWWSTRAIPGVPCAFSCFVTWSAIVAANPDAKIVGGFGANHGSGWAGDFVGAFDGFTMGANGSTTVYDFEPGPGDPAAKADCKNGGWEQYGFKNQGQCIKFVNTGKDSR